MEFEINGFIYDKKIINKYFNRIYDWGDEHGIKIDTIVKTQTDVNAQIQPQEETQPQNNNLIK